jgi:hypothetical protein
MATPKKKITPKAVKPVKERIVLNKPTKPVMKEPVRPKIEPMFIDDALTDKEQDKIQHILEDLSKACHKACGFQGSYEKDKLGPAEIRLVADLMEEALASLPGIPETKTLSLTCIDIGYGTDCSFSFDYDAMSMPSLEVINEIMEEYTQEKEDYENILKQYEEDLVAYNSEASKAARKERKALETSLSKMDLMAEYLKLRDIINKNGWY